MSRQLLQVCVIASLGLCASILHGDPAPATMVFNNGMVNSINAPIEDIEVRNGPGDSSTVVNVMTGADIGIDGDDRSIGLLENSVLSFSGGSTQGDVIAEDDSMAFLQGTSLVRGNLSMEGNSRLEFSDDSVVEGDVEIQDDATATFTGGTVEGELVVSGNAMTTISGGTFEDTIVLEDDAMVMFFDGTAEDNVEAEGDSKIDILGGEIQGSVEAVDNAKLNITGGAFPNVFSDGEDVFVSGVGAEANITNAVLGIAGENGGGRIVAGQSSVVHVSNISIAGQPDGTAPTANLTAILNGNLNASNIAFGDLELVADTGGTLNLDNITADHVFLSMLGGGTTNLRSGTADSLEVRAEISSNLGLMGGDFGDTEVALFSSSVMRIFGHSFTFLGMPVETLPAEGFIPETGELLAIGGTLAGVLADGTPFSMAFSRQFSPPGQAAHVFLVPEPGTIVFMLLACAGLGTGRARGREQRRGEASVRW